MATIGNFELPSAPDELLQWSVRSSGPETVVALAGEIDLACEATLRQVLADVVAGHPETIAVDLTNVSFLDSTGIRQLVIAANAASESGSKLVVRHCTETIERTLEICGLRDRLLEDTSRNATEGR